MMKQQHNDTSNVEKTLYPMSNENSMTTLDHQGYACAAQTETEGEDEEEYYQPSGMA